jgi:multidrug resistance protein, MATE family
MNKIIAKEIKESFFLSLPLIASNLLRAASGFVGTLMVGHLGSNALDGLALGSSVFFTLVVFFIGMLNAISVLVSQNFGAKNNQGIRTSVSQGFIMAVIVSIPMYLIVWCSPVIFKFTNESAQIIQLATTYLRTISLAILPFAFLVVMNQFLVGMSKTRLVLCISLLQVPFEVALTYLLVNGGMGIPKFGIAGVGYAFTIVFSAAAICIGVFIAKSKNYIHFKVFAEFGRINSSYLLDLIRVGWPIGCMAVIEVALFAAITFFMGELGDDRLAAFQILNQYVGISIMIIFAMSQVTTIRVGQAVGRRDKSAIKRAAFVNMLICQPPKFRTFKSELI